MGGCDGLEWPFEQLGRGERLVNGNIICVHIAFVT